MPTDQKYNKTIPLLQFYFIFKYRCDWLYWWTIKKQTQTVAGRWRRFVGSEGWRGAAGSEGLAGVDLYAPDQQPPQAGRGEAKIPFGGSSHPGRNPGGADLSPHVVFFVPPIPGRSGAQFEGKPPHPHNTITNEIVRVHCYILSLSLCSLVFLRSWLTSGISTFSPWATLQQVPLSAISASICWIAMASSINSRCVYRAVLTRTTP